MRVKEKYVKWIDADLSDVLLQRKRYFEETEYYDMAVIDVAKADDILKLPDSSDVTVILGGISMYLTNNELKNLLSILQKKYGSSVNGCIYRIWSEGFKIQESRE